MPASLVRNLRPGPTTLTPIEGSTEYLVWQGAGDPEGQDVQLVSEDAAKSIPFQRAVARQLLALEGDDVIELDPGVRAHLDRQAALAEAKRAAAEAKVESSIDHTEQRVLHGLFCVGPNTRGTGTCDVMVSVPGKNKDLIPPLCEAHKYLASQYVSEVVQEGDKGVTKWVRTQMAPREKAQLQ